MFSEFRKVSSNFINKIHVIWKSKMYKHLHNSFDVSAESAICEKNLNQLFPTMSNKTFKKNPPSDLIGVGRRPLTTSSPAR